MKFALAIPQFYADGEFDPAAVRAYFARAEELGFDSAWTQESMLGAWAQLGPIEAMTYAAACTQRMRLGCVVFVSTLHSPVHLAKSVSTLDQLSQGRLEIGVGTGGKSRPFAAFGVDPARYLSRFTEGIALMKALWTEPLVTVGGELGHIRDWAVDPKPFQKPFPPLWFGGASEPALRRAVRLGHGFFGAGSSSTAKFAEQVQIVRAALAEASRPAEDFPIAKRVYTAIDQRMVGNLDVANNVFLARGHVGEDRRHQIVAANALNLWRDFLAALEAQQRQRAVGVPTPAGGEDGRRQRRLLQHFLHCFGLQVVEDITEREAMLLGQGDVQPVVGCGSLQLKIK